MCACVDVFVLVRDCGASALLLAVHFQACFRSWQTSRLWQDLRSLLSELRRFGCRNQRSVLLVVNSRTKLEAGLDGTIPIELKPLEHAAAKELLLRLSGAAAEWGQGEALQLACICGCNALTITLTAGFIANKRCTPRVSYFQMGHPRGHGGTGGVPTWAHELTTCRCTLAWVALCSDAAAVAAALLLLLLLLLLLPC
jgi:hypothetical protein